jgi:hypothetical protein
MRFYTDTGWQNANLLRMKWHGGAAVKVRNFSVKKNKTYFANRGAVHNLKNFYPELQA